MFWKLNGNTHIMYYLPSWVQQKFELKTREDEFSAAVVKFQFELVPWVNALCFERSDNCKKMEVTVFEMK